jgi:hypothetical protein
MDPITLIVSALVAGAAAATKDTASEAIKDAYHSLKNLLMGKFAGKPKAQAALVDYEEDPETYEKPLKKALTETHIDQDQDILEAAQKLMTLVQPQQMGMGKYNIQNTGTVQGQVIGEHNQVTQHFGEPPES